MKSLLIVVVTIVTTSFAQELAPELAPLVAKHKADLAALEAQKAAAITRVIQSYVVALDSAEKTATTAGKIDIVAAITKERESLTSGRLAPAAPEDLPKTLHSARKACIDGVARAASDAIPRQKAIDADYLRALAGLMPKASGKPELAMQIATEKKNLLAVAAASDPRLADFMGKWRLTDDGGGVREITISDKDVAIAGGDHGNWTVENGFMVFHWPNGFQNRVSLSSSGNTRKAEELKPGGKEWVQKFKMTR